MATQAEYDAYHNSARVKSAKFNESQQGFAYQAGWDREKWTGMKDPGEVTAEAPTPSAAPPPAPAPTPAPAPEPVGVTTTPGGDPHAVPQAPQSPVPSPTPQGAASPMASLQAAAAPGAGWAQSATQSQTRPGLGASSMSPMQRLFSGRAY